MDTGKPMNEVRPKSQVQQPKAKVTTQAFQGGQGLNAKFFRNELNKHHPHQRAWPLHIEYSFLFRHLYYLLKMFSPF